MTDTHLNLLDILSNGLNKKNLLLSWISRIRKGECYSDNAREVLEQITRFMKDLAFLSVEDAKSYESQVLANDLSELVIVKVIEIKDNPSIVLDFTTTLSYIFSEQLEHLTEDSSSKKQLKKQKNSYTYSISKLYSVTMLCRLYQCCGDSFNSLTPLVVSSILKNMKRTLEKTKYYNANYLTRLMQLFDIISRSASRKCIDESSYQKFSKISREAISDIKNERFDYSVDFLASLISSLFGCYTRETFTNVHFSTLLNHFESKIRPFLVCFFKKPNLRLIMAKTLAEILYFYATENDIEFKDAVIFYSNLLTDFSSRSEKISVLLSFSECLSLSRMSDFSFLQGTKYLELFGIFISNLVFESEVDTFRYMEWFEKMHELIVPFVGDSSKKLILSKIFSTSDGLLSLSEPSFCILYLNLSDKLLDDLSVFVHSEDEILLEIKNSLMNLCTCENYHIRILANQTMRKFLYYSPVLISEIMVQSFKVLTDQFELEKGFAFAKNHGLALLISSVLGIDKKDYVPYELVMKVSFFATGLLKNNTLSTTDVLYEKQLLSWILLTGVISYKDQEFLKIQSSQLFIFWKNILTHSYNHKNEVDLLRNLELRNHSLACMLNFLKNVPVDDQIATQTFYLVSKCSNFNGSLTPSSELISNCILRNEQRTLQIYEIISHYVIKDFGTSLLLQMLKNFACPDFPVSGKECITGSYGEEAGMEATKSFKDLVESEMGENYGLSSYVCECKDIELRYELDNYVANPIVRSVCFDYFSLLFKTEKPADSYTSIVNSSIKLFSTCFPILNSKVQYSVLETLNSYVSRKGSCSYRGVAIRANVFHALKNALGNIYEGKRILAKEVATLFLTVIDLCCFEGNEVFLKEKANCYGKICHVADKSSEDENLASNLMKVSVKRIIENENPYSRMLNLATASEIYRFSSTRVSFGDVFSLVLTLLNDPHPVVHYWSLRSLKTILKKHNSLDIAMFSKLIVLFEGFLLNDNYGRYGCSTFSNSYSAIYHSHEIISDNLSLMIELVGPDLFSCTDEVMTKVLNILSIMLSASSIHVKMEGLRIGAMFTAFKKDDVFDVKLSLQIVKDIIFSHLVGDFEKIPSRICYRSFYEVGSKLRTSYGFNKCLLFLMDLEKLYNTELFSDFEVENTLWLSLVFYPKHELLKSVLRKWIECTSIHDFKGLLKLLIVFNLSRDKVLASILGSGGSNTLLPNLFSSNEDENSIVLSVGSAESEIKAENETIAHDMKLFIVDLIIEYLRRSDRNSKTFNLASHRISDLVRICFSCASSSVEKLKLSGLNLLDFIIKKFSAVKDKDAEENSILLEHEARIITAVLALFSKESSSDVVSSGLLVVADLIGARIVPFGRLKRICSILQKALVDFAEKKPDIFIGEFLIQNQNSRKRIEASVLYAWATLKIESCDFVEEDVSYFVCTNLEVLVPLWIVFLRDRALVRYTDENYKHFLEMGFEDSCTLRKNSKYVECKFGWLKLVKAICCVNQENPALIKEYLSTDDMSGFAFVLFSQMMECLVDNREEEIVLLNVLSGLRSLYVFPEEMVSIYFDERLQPEIIAVFDRLVLMENEETKILVVKLVGNSICAFLDCCEDLSSSLMVDFVYDYLHIITKVLSSQNHEILDMSISVERKSEDERSNNGNYELSWICFDTLSEVVPKFPIVLKWDLYSCCLFIAGKVLLSRVNHDKVGCALRLVKKILEDSQNDSEGRKIIDIFIDSVIDTVINDLSVDHCIVLIMVFVETGYENFTSEDAEKVSNNLFEGLQSCDFDQVCVHGIKRLMAKANSSFFVSKMIMNLLLKLLNYEGSEIGGRLIAQIFHLFYVELKCNSDDEGQYKTMVVMNVLLKLFKGGKLDEHDVIDKMEYLIKTDCENFKECLYANFNSDDIEIIKELFSNNLLGTNVEESMVQLKLFE